MSLTPDIQLLPNGHLVPPDARFLPRKVARAFSESTASGLLSLATDALEETLPPGLTFWRGIAHRYLACLRQAPPEALEGEDAPAPLPEMDVLESIVSEAPPAPGMEYLNTSRLAASWDAIDEHVAGEAADDPNGLNGWLKKRSPLWSLVGRVTFHLAENKKNEHFPFAFLATYTHQLTGSGRLQYLPLGKAITTYAGKNDTRTLRTLLSPVQEAATRSELARELLDSRHVFQALAWTPADAHRFIRDTPLLEEAGLVVKVPDWWKNNRPSRVFANLELDVKKHTSVGFDSLLSFNINIALDGETLSQEEWQHILDTPGNLVSIKGHWVEVDKEKLQQVLEHWEKVEAGGIGFLEGMRLLAGMPGASADVGTPTPEGGGDWSQVTAGGRLRELLSQMRDPAAASAVRPGKNLHASLRHYQQDGLNWLWLFYNLRLGACLADDMGLGKTLQIIALLLQIKKSKNRPTEPSLLVVPASLVGNWRAEVERFAPSLKIFYAHRSQASKEELADLPAQVAGRDAVVTTYSTLARLDTLTKTPWNLLVLDEAQAIKNPRSGQTRRVKQLHARTRIALTGTPVENSAGDLWSLFDFLNPGLLGTASRFAETTRHLSAEGGSGYAPLRRLVSPYILRRLKTDPTVIDDLPDKTEIRTHTGLTKGQATLYQKSVRQLADELRDAEGIQRSGLVLSYLMRFKQICDHPSLWTGSGNFLEKDSGKFRRLRTLAEEIAARGEKFLVFTQFREMTTPIADFLESVLGHSGLILHGGTAVKRRHKLVGQFQSDGGPPYFVISLKAGGTGLNLTAASHVVHFDRWWNPAVEDQATDRAFRIGQKRNVLVHKFVCPGTVEEKIDHLITEKKELAQELLNTKDSAEKNLTHMADDELLKFVSLDIDSAVF